MRGLRARDENQALPLRQNLGFQAVFNFDRGNRVFFSHLGAFRCVYGAFWTTFARYRPFRRVYSPIRPCFGSFGCGRLRFGSFRREVSMVN